MKRIAYILAGGPVSRQTALRALRFRTNVAVWAGAEHKVVVRDVETLSGRVAYCVAIRPCETDGADVWVRGGDSWGEGLILRTPERALAVAVAICQAMGSGLDGE